MELRHLRYFIVLAEELHFGNAARRLFIAQPPLSRQIKELEKELGVELFNREHKRVRLTEAGKYFLAEAEQLMDRLELTRQKVGQIRDSLAGEINIGYISSIDKKCLGWLLGHLQQHYPFLQARLFEASTERQLRALEKAKLHIGLIRAPNLSHSVQTELLYEDGFALVCSKQMQLPKDLSMLSEMPFITYHPNYVPIYHEKVTAYAAGLGFKPRLSHSCNNIPSILDLVELGVGISIVPSSVIAQYGHLDLQFYQPASSRVLTEVLLAYPRHEVHPALGVIKDLLTKLFKTELDTRLP